jgi:hypothetical protein
MSIENGNCSSVCPLSHWSKKLTNHESVLLKLTTHESVLIKLTNQGREPLLMRESDFFSVIKTNIKISFFSERR